MARNGSITAEVALEKSHHEMDVWKQTKAVDIEFYDILRKDITASLKQQDLAEYERNNLVAEKKSLDDMLAVIRTEKKTIESNIKSKREALKMVKKRYKDVREKKTKIDRPVRAEVILILEKY